MRQPRILATRLGAKLTLNHRESFCLMKYQRRHDGAIEWIWNSRDGVTPFSVGPYGEDPDVEMQHLDFHEDAFAPNFVPPVGMRVFMSWGNVPQAYRDVAALSDAAEASMKETDPWVVVVDEVLHAIYQRRARDNPYLPVGA